MNIVMEPDRTTAPEHLDVLAALSRLETIFHWPPSGMSRAELLDMMVDVFWETGASGRRYSKEYVLDALQKRQLKVPPDVYETSDFHVRKLAPDVYLLTYTLVQDGTRLTRRASIWKRSDAAWKCVYHQGTVVD